MRRFTTFWMDVRSPTFSYDSACPDPEPMACDAGGDTASESREEISGSDVIRPMVATFVWLALATLIL